jgi:hypothetical protein
MIEGLSHTTCSWGMQTSRTCLPAGRGAVFKRYGIERSVKKVKKIHQVGVKELNESESLMRCRKRYLLVELQGRVLL